jgi:hypothetical protein
MDLFILIAGEDGKFGSYLENQLNAGEADRGPGLFALGIWRTSRRPPSAACWRGSWTASPARTSRSCRPRCRGSPRRWLGRVRDEKLHPQMTQIERRWKTVLSAYICVICGFVVSGSFRGTVGRGERGAAPSRRPPGKCVTFAGNTAARRTPGQPARRQRSSPRPSHHRSPDTGVIAMVAWIVTSCVPRMTATSCCVPSLVNILRMPARFHLAAGEPSIAVMTSPF